VPWPCRTLWAPGIRAGIPARSVVFRTLNASDYGDGTVEASGAISEALAACPVDQTVALSDGRFLCNNYIHHAKANTLRGAGIRQTLLVKTNGATPGQYPNEQEPVMIIGPSRWPKLDETTVMDLASDGLHGDSTVTVHDATGFATGQFVLLDEDDYTYASWRDCPMRTRPDGTTYHNQIWASDRVVFMKHNPSEAGDDPFPDSLSWFSRPGRPLCEIKEIAAVEGNVITFTTPLHATYFATQDAQIVRWLEPHTQGAGLEDLSVEGGADHNIIFNAAAHCWMMRVESSSWWGEAVSVQGSFRCDVRDSDIHDGAWPYPGGAGYGISLSAGSSEILIENNFVLGMNKVMAVKSAGAGSVVGYNYMDNPFIGNAHEWVEVGINGSHMVGGHHILFEGNQSNNYDSDDTHGNAICMTIFRNHLIGRRRDYPNIQNVRAAGLMLGSYWHSFIGNVLGEPGMEGWIYENAWPWNGPTIWQFGYAPTHWEQAADPKVLETVLRDGNFDYATHTVHWDRPEQPLPDSLYLAARPAFFPAGWVWPWVDPYAPVNLRLPARERFEAWKTGQ
jgi:hypothetical protein